MREGKIWHKPMVICQLTPLFELLGCGC